jgi:ABC-2 type transport system permease protein
MNALRIALKDIQIYLKDRANIVNLFLVPLAFIFAISMAVPGFGAEEGEPIELPVVNLDPGGEASRALIADLNAGGAVQVELYDQGFSQDIEAGRPITLQMLNHPNADEQEIEALLRAVNGVAQQSSLIAQLIASLSQMGEMQAAGPDEPQAFTPNRNVAQAQSQFERAKTSPLVVVEQTRPQALVEAVEDPNVLQQNVPGYTIIIVFATAGLTAASIFDEKKVGSFRRLLAAPISKATILAGKMIPNFAIALIQVVVIFAVSILVLPSLGQERLTLGDDPLALVLVSLALALCSTAFGVLIAALARTEGQINTVGGLGVWVLGALGGCIIPIFLLEGMSLGPISRLTPHNWAIRAYHDLLIRGRGLADVTTEIIALLVFSAVFFAIGLWRFEFD